MPYPSFLSCSSQGSSQSADQEQIQKYDHHYGLGGLQPPNGVAIPATASTTNLCTRLAVLTRDHKEAQMENTQKQAVIEYLLNSRILESRLEKEVVELHKEISSLKQKLIEHTKDGKQLRIDLHKALDSISALAARNTVSITSQPTSSPSKDNSKAHNTAAVDTQDLIDFSDHNGGSAITEPASGGTTLLDDEDDDDCMSDLTDDVDKYAQTQSATISFNEDFDFNDSPYIHHFVNGDGATNSKGAKKVAATTNEQSGKCEQLNACLAAVRGSAEASGSSENYTLTPSGGASPSTSYGVSGNTESAPTTSSLAGHKGNLEGNVSLWQTYAGYSVGDEESLHSATPHKSEKGAVFINKCTAGFEDPRHPDVFKYGLRFIPSHNERNVYRTVTISGLPANTTMFMILNNVRGGAVLDSKLLNTLKISGSNTALIIFLQEHSAFAYEEYAKKHPIIFNGLIAKVAVVPTPTWPIKPNIYKAVFDHKHSRCLEVHNFPRSISPSELKFDHLVHTEMGKDGILVLQFSSIDGAGCTYRMLSSFMAYRDCEPHFTSDPCSQPLETLLPRGKIDINVAKSQNLVHNCPSSISKTSSPVSSDGSSSSELIASAEP